MREKIILFVLSVILLAGCQQKAKNQEAVGKPAEEGGKIMSLKVESPAFVTNGKIPAEYSCEGDDVSPEIHWSGAPSSTRSFVLICDDPDAPMGTWVHWVIYDIPGDETGLKRNIPKTNTLANGAKQGKNSGGRIGYNGPCPPRGTHRYYFKVYALDTMLNLPAGETKMQVLEAMAGHMIAQGELMGTYQR